MEITTGTPSAASGTERDNSLSELSADYEAFLQLLTAQVANQDPLAPMDSSTFVTQLAQLSQVEQTVQSNERLAEISAQLSTAAAHAEVGLIGREVDVPGDRIVPRDDGSPIGVLFEEAVPDYTVRLVDADGVVVRELRGAATEAGAWTEVTWDGADAAGDPASGGPFDVEIVASGTSGLPVVYTTRIRAQVETVTWSPAGPQLGLDTGDEISSGDVLRVT